MLKPAFISRLQYTIWFSTRPTASEAVTLALTSPLNTTFYSAMVQASDIDNRFAFEAHDWPNGHYIHTLGGRQEEPGKFNYWLLYRLTEMPDPNNPPGNECIKSVSIALKSCAVNRIRQINSFAISRNFRWASTNSWSKIIYTIFIGSRDCKWFSDHIEWYTLTLMKL